MRHLEFRTTGESLSIIKLDKELSEVRILNSTRGTISGYFNDYQKLADVVAEYDGKVPAIYFTLNPVKPDLLSRAANRVIQRAKIRLQMLILNADVGFRLILTQYVQQVFHQRKKNTKLLTQCQQ